MRPARSILLIMALLVLSSSSLYAHEIRPGYLELREVASEKYEVLWKQPARGAMRLKLDPVFPEDCEAGFGDRGFMPGALVTRTTLAC